MGQENAISAETAEEGVREIALLRTIVEGTAHPSGEGFLQNLVRHAAQAIGVRHTFAAELLPGGRIRTLAFWSNGKLVDNIEYDLAGTPCEEVLNGGICHIASDVLVTGMAVVEQEASEAVMDETLHCFNVNSLYGIDR